MRDFSQIYMSDFHYFKLEVRQYKVVIHGLTVSDQVGLCWKCCTFLKFNEITTLNIRQNLTQIQLNRRSSGFCFRCPLMQNSFINRIACNKHLIIVKFIQSTNLLTMELRTKHFYTK